MQDKRSVYDHGAYWLIIEVKSGVRTVLRTPKAGGGTPHATSQPRKAEATNGLGDWAEKALSKIGITKERYVDVKKACGLPPTCGCSKRQEWLNAVGKHFGIGT